MARGAVGREGEAGRGGGRGQEVCVGGWRCRGGWGWGGVGEARPPAGRGEGCRPAAQASRRRPLLAEPSSAEQLWRRQGKGLVGLVVYATRARRPWPSPRSAPSLDTSRRTTRAPQSAPPTTHHCRARVEEGVCAEGEGGGGEVEQLEGKGVEGRLVGEGAGDGGPGGWEPHLGCGADRRRGRGGARGRCAFGGG